MHLRYRGNIILESDDINQLENAKAELVNNMSNKYIPLLTKLNELSEIGAYLPKNEGDVCAKEYFDKIRKYNTYFLSLLEEVSTAIFSGKNISKPLTYYIRNPQTGMYGVIIDGKKYSHTKMSMIVRDYLPLQSDFEIF